MASASMRFESLWLSPWLAAIVWARAQTRLTTMVFVLPRQSALGPAMASASKRFDWPLDSLVFFLGLIHNRAYDLLIIL